MIESGMLENDGAAFGAVLNIGDKRACDLLIPLRDSLDHDAISNVINCSTGFIHSSTVDFYLDWLEGMAGTDQDGDFGLVAAGLGLLKKRSRTDQVFIGHRPFPTRGATPEQWKAFLFRSIFNVVHAVCMHWNGPSPRQGSCPMHSPSGD